MNPKSAQIKKWYKSIWSDIIVSSQTLKYNEIIFMHTEKILFYK